MTDQQQRTQWALDRFESFVQKWCPPGAHLIVYGHDGDANTVRRCIDAIAPVPFAEQLVGYGVFQREIDSDWDIRQRPSGFVHTLTSAVFDKLGHAQNAHQCASKRHPDHQYVICEIREIP